MRNLTLSKETLRILNDDALKDVGGGQTGFCQISAAVACIQTQGCVSGQVCTVGCVGL